MSYDVSIETPNGAEGSVNYTYNCSNMFNIALSSVGGINGLHGKKAADCIEPLVAAISAMNANLTAFRELNPSNGWGSAEGAIAFLADILAMCCRRRDGYVRVS